MNCAQCKEPTEGYAIKRPSLGPDKIGVGPRLRLVESDKPAYYVWDCPNCGYMNSSWRKSLPILALKQPWAGMLFHGKDVENRGRNCNLRSRVLIYATKDPDLEYEAETFRWVLDNIGEIPLGMEHNARGKIIGSVEIYEVTTTSQSPWAMDGSYHWQLRQPVLYPTYDWVECRGQLGFFYRDEAEFLR